MATVTTKYSTGDTSVDDTLKTPLVAKPELSAPPSRGYDVHRYRLSSDFTLTSTTSLQSMFGKSFIVEKGKTYLFRARATLTAMSATSGAFSLGFGGGVIGSIQYTASALKSATGTQGGGGIVASKVATAIALVAASTATEGTLEVLGTFVANADGLFTPQIALGVAAAAKVEAGSFLEVSEINPNDVLGNFV